MKLTTVLRLFQCILLVWRLDTMYKRTMNVVKGLGMGVLAGTVVAAIGTKAMGSGKKASHMKKNAGKAIHTVGNLIGDVERMLK